MKSWGIVNDMTANMHISNEKKGAFRWSDGDKGAYVEEEAGENF